MKYQVILSITVIYLVRAAVQHDKIKTEKLTLIKSDKINENSFNQHWSSNGVEPSCKIVGVFNYCEKSDDCCDMCCTNGSCLDARICNGVCLETSELSQCNQQEDCCSQCCDNNQCVDMDVCQEKVAVWIIWLSSICGSFLCIGIVVGVILCIVKKKNREAAAQY